MEECIKFADWISENGFSREYIYNKNHNIQYTAWISVRNTNGKIQYYPDDLLTTDLEHYITTEDLFKRFKKENEKI